jgi:hypothetical protein
VPAGVQLSREPKRRIYKTVIVRYGRLAGAILLGDLDRMPFLTQALDNGSVLPQARVAAVRPRPAAHRRPRRGTRAGYPGLQLQRRQQSRHRLVRDLGQADAARDRDRDARWDRLRRLQGTRATHRRIRRRQSTNPRGGLTRGCEPRPIDQHPAAIDAVGKPTARATRARPRDAPLRAVTNASPSRRATSS